VALAACLAFAAAGVAAPARTLFAGAEALPGASCTEGDPCQLTVAAELAESGDAIFLEPGDYQIGTEGIAIDDAVDIGGSVKEKPVIETSETNQVLIEDPDAVLHDVLIEGAGPLKMTSGTAERVSVAFDGTTSTDAEGVAACKLNIDPGETLTLRDSVCWAREAGAQMPVHALSIGGGGADQDDNAILRNVTAVAAGAQGDGVHVSAQSGVRIHVDGRNLIARSLHGHDVAAEADTGVRSQAKVELQNSSYGPPSQVPPNNFFVQVTPAGSGANQTADPQFVDGEDGDFHLAGTSPALDAGAADPSIGSTDFDGENRSQAKCLGPESRAIPDIGAFERRPTSSCPLRPPPPPPPVEPFKAVFRLLSLKLNRHTGAGSAQIEVPGPGIAAVTGSGIQFVRRPATGPGTLTLPIKPWVITLVRLNKRGKTKVQLKIKFESQAGSTQVIKRGLLLKRKFRHKLKHRPKRKSRHKSKHKPR
jgi:hypothetical protein